MTTPPITPLRLQRSRRKGSRLVSPNGLPIVCCTRPGKFGNPYTVRPANRQAAYFSCLTREEAIEEFRDALNRIKSGGVIMTNPRTGSEISISDVQGLLGKNLSCWCGICPKHAKGKPLNEKCPDCVPCHIDVIAAYLYPAPKRSRTVQFVHADGTVATSKTTNKKEN